VVPLGRGTRRARAAGDQPQVVHSGQAPGWVHVVGHVPPSSWTQTGVALPGTLQHASPGPQHDDPQHCWLVGHVSTAHMRATQVPWSQIWSLAQ
jgi:hypothetical protein